MNVKNPLQIQRLIDGELSIEEVQQLLSSIEPESDNWKKIATSFVENQFLQSQFDKMDAPFTEPIQLQPGSNSGARLPLSWIWSLAASALLTTSIGVMIGANYFSNDALRSDFPAVANSTLAAEDRASNQLESTPAVYRMQVEDKDGNQFIDSDIPFYQVANWNDVGQHKFEEYPDDLRNRVLKSGYDLQQDTRFFRGRLHDGRQFVIPIRNTQFAPYQ